MLRRYYPTNIIWKASGSLFINTTPLSYLFIFL